MIPSFDTILGISSLLGVVCAIHAILARRRESTGTLAWALVGMLPLIGPLIYVTMGTDHAGRRRRHRVRNVRAQHQSHIEEARKCWRDALSASSGLIRRGIQDQGYFPPSFGNQVALLVSGEPVFDAMVRDIEAAKSSIDLLTYIVDDDETTQRVADALIVASNRGVKIRVVYDYLGASDGRGLIRRLKAGGVNALPYLAPHPLRRGFHISLRNHRKIMVVDDTIAYIGSMNLSGRHCGNPPRSMDVMARMIGPVALDCAAIVDADWAFAAAEQRRWWQWNPRLPEAFKTLTEVRPRTCAPGVGPDEVIQVVPSGPDDPSLGVTRMLITAIHQADHSVDLITPYFIPPQALLGALQSARARGVAVRLLVPEKTDSWVVGAAMKTWLGVALDAEIEVRMDRDGFLHEKMAIIDKNLAFMGSSNLDQRSAFLNFEADIVAYGASFPKELAAHFDALWTRSAPCFIPIWMLPLAIRRRGDSKSWIVEDGSSRFSHPFKRLLYRLAWVCSPIL